MQYRQSFAPGANWQNSENHTDVIDPQRVKAAREACYQQRFQEAFQEAAKRAPKHLSTDEAMSRNVGFIVMDYGKRSLRGWLKPLAFRRREVRRNGRRVLRP
jgi:hypothetical protein